MYDQVPGIKIIATGSLALNIKNKMAESMAGRKIEYHLFPLTLSEFLTQKGITSSLDYRVLENIIENNQLMPDRKFHTFDLKGIMNDILV